MPNIHYYAQIDLDTNRVVGVSQLSGKVDYPHMIPTQPEDYGTILGWQYDPATETFVEVADEE